MKIGIDIDDTIMETFKTMLKYADKYDKEVLHKNGRINKIGSSINSYLQDIYDWTYQDVIDFLEKDWVTLIKECTPKKDVSKYINKLFDEGNKIYFVTARSSYFSSKDNDVELITKKFLEDNNIKYNNIIFGSNDKIKPCIDNKIDIFIDDSYNICKNLKEQGIKTYLMTSIVNQTLDNKDIERVNNWKYLYNKIKEYQNNIES